MILQNKTLEKLRQLINEETEYRSGPQLVSFFNQLGFRDSYNRGGGFPSRWIYTDEKLATINGTPEIDKCIKVLLAPINFVGRYQVLDKLIADFNEYLQFDGWVVVRKNTNIEIAKAENIKIETKEEPQEDEFLKKEFEGVSIELLNLESILTDVLNGRITEIRSSLNNNSPLAVIFLCGSTLEGILLGIAQKNPMAFNKAASAPKDKEGKTKGFYEWTLNNFIDVSFELGFLQEDVRKFSHSLRDFRNYIHPYQQALSRFNPDQHTAKICWQVLKAAIYQIGRK